MKDLNRAHLYSIYFAPRGRERLLNIGEQLGQIHLSYRDKLIGIVGDAGSGKSLIIKGMFPGLSLTNDDDQINSFEIMQVRNDLDADYSKTTYHLDMRFQMAFTQMFEIVDFVKGALAKGRRVIIEHFDLLYPALNIKADIIFGIGAEILVTRPNMFGPLPKDVYDIVFKSLRNRKMAHTAEDLTTLVLMNDYKIKFKLLNSDVRKGFVLNFKDKPDILIEDIEQKVKQLIEKDLDVFYYNEDHIKIGEHILSCSGPRIHLRTTGDIEDFHLVKEYKFDVETNMYCLIGIINSVDFDEKDLNKIRSEAL